MERERRDGHTILFLQVTDGLSRTYADYKNPSAAFYGMCEMFEETYKKKTAVSDVAYDISDVITYFKSFTDVMLMVFDDDLRGYVARHSNWIFEQLLEYGKEGPTDDATAAAAAANGEEGDEDFEEDWE